MEGSQNHRYYIYNIKGSDMGYCLIFNFQIRGDSLIDKNELAGCDIMV